MAPELKSIQRVEVFSAGKWNGDAYTETDLDEMVRAFQETKAQPALKLGHSDKQQLLQKDGYPAAGYISNLYREGSKLRADFVEMPAKIAELVKRKAYKRVSCEIFWNIDINGKKYKRMLSAVSLLGGDMPAVDSLDDMLALYGVRNADRLGVYATGVDESNLRTYDLEAEQMPTENELKLEAELKQAKEKSEADAAALKKYEADIAAKDEAAASAAKELEELKQFKAEADKRAAEAEKVAHEAKLDQAVSELEKSKSFSPAMKPYVRELIGDEKKEYAIGDRKLSKTEMVAEILKLHAAACGVNFEEQSKAGDDDQKKKDQDPTDLLDEKIQKYAAEHKVSYSAAYKAVLKQEKAK